MDGQIVLPLYPVMHGLGTQRRNEHFAIGLCVDPLTQGTDAGNIFRGENPTKS